MFKYIQIVGLPVPSVSMEEELRFSHLINEDRHLELNIGQKAIGYLKKNLKLELMHVDNETLKRLILPTWRHYNDFCINCMNIDLYLLETDFNKPMLAVREMQKIVPSIDIKIVFDTLKGSMTGTYGLSFRITEKSYIILINSAIYKDDEKIQHEFGHYVQEVTGKLILDSDIKEDVKKYFQIDDQYASYILNEREFWINIFSDMFSGLQKIYWLEFKNTYIWEEFIEDQFNVLKLNVSNFMKTQLFKFWCIYVKTNTFYIRILATISYVKPDFYDEIIEKLKNKK